MMSDTSRVKVAYVHNVLMPYKLPLLRRVSADPRLELRVFAGVSHWPASKLHRHVRDTSEVDLRLLATADLCVNYRGRQAHLFYSPGLIRELSQYRPDIVVAGLSNLPNNVSLHRWALEVRVPYVWHGIGSVYTTKSPVRRLFDPFLRRFIDDASGGVAFNSRSRQYYVTHYGVDLETIAVVQNVVDTSRVRRVAAGVKESRVPGCDNVQLVFVGALQPAKNVQGLISAVAILVSRGVPVTLTVIGDGPMLNSLRGQVREEGLSDLVRFLGSLEFDATTSVVAAANLSVFPGLGGLAVSHSLAAGTCVIATAGDGSTEDQIVQDVNGLLLPDGSPITIAAHVERALSNGLHMRHAFLDPQVVQTASSIDIEVSAGRMTEMVLSHARQGLWT